MICITGDTHAEFRRLYEIKGADYVIICGDFGGIWRHRGDLQQEKTLDLLSTLSFTILFIDGNHGATRC